MVTPLLTVHQITTSFGGPPLLEEVSLALCKGDRFCLVGRNGSGKSTLLRILANEQEPESGKRFVQPGTKIAYLPQELPSSLDKTVHAFVTTGTEATHEAEAIITQLKLMPDQKMEGLSGGELRRVSLAKTLAQRADILLLDEPTNHLDVETIEWLESYLQQEAGAILIISHDRRFLEILSTSTLWLHHRHLYSQTRGFKDFERWSDSVLRDEQKKQERLDTKVKQELEWLRHGITARRRRNQGRLRHLEQLRQQRRAFLKQQGFSLKNSSRGGEGSSQQIIVAHTITKAFNNKIILQPFSLRIGRGDRIGIIGPNGVGKTTLLKLLLGDSPPDGGTIQYGTTLTVTHIDQLQTTLNLTKTAWENLCPGDYINVQGSPRHVVGYLRDFLFMEAQAQALVSTFSGGERNRLALAKGLAQPGNLLVMDEPTNDLDMETLDLLVDLLHDYKGTLLLVSHDRDFLEKVVTSLLVMEEGGYVQEYIGGYQDYIRARPSVKTLAKKTSKKSFPSPPRLISRRLSYHQKRELQILPGKLEALSQQIAFMEKQLSQPDFYQTQKTEFMRLTKQLERTKKELETAENLWLELSLMAECHDS